MATQLENNTSSLQTVLSAVNALPNQSNSTNITTKAISLSFNSALAGLAWTSLNSNGALQQNVLTSAFPTSINAVVGTSVVIFNAAGNIVVDGNFITTIDYSAAIPVSSSTSEIETTHGGGSA